MQAARVTCGGLLRSEQDIALGNLYGDDKEQRLDGYEERDRVVAKLGELCDRADFPVDNEVERGD